MGSIFSGLMNQNINYIYSVSLDSAGDEATTLVYSDVSCRWVERLNRTVNNQGEEVVSKVDVWIPPTYTIEYDYQVVKGTETYLVIGREYKRDIFGNVDHVRLYLV